MQDDFQRTSDDEEFAKELAALARLVTYARLSAQSLNIAFPTYCLDLTLGAVLDEMRQIGVDTRIMANDDYGIPVGFH
jgi:hypothetical protein